MIIETWGYYLYPLQTNNADSINGGPLRTNREYLVDSEGGLQSLVTTEYTPVLSMWGGGSEYLFSSPVIYAQPSSTINPDPDLTNYVLYVTYLDPKDNNQLLGETVNFLGGPSVTIDANAFIDRSEGGSGTQFVISEGESSSVVSVGKFQAVT
jgi:hypothetical protein